MIVKLGSGRDSASFDADDGFRLQSLVLGGQELIAQDSGLGVFWWGSFVMAPWTSNLMEGRFRFLDKEYSVPVDEGNTAIHGIVRKHEWHWDGFIASCAISSDWPFGGHVQVRPELSNSLLTMHMTLVAGNQPMPGAIGWHPWFVRRINGVEGEIGLPSDALLQHRDSKGVPSGLWQQFKPGPLNDGLRLLGPVDLSWPGVGKVRVESDGGYMVVFNDNDHGICIEPMTSPAGTMDRLLSPGESVDLQFTLQWVAGESRESRLAAR